MNAKHLLTVATATLILTGCGTGCGAAATPLPTITPTPTLTSTPTLMPTRTPDYPAMTATQRAWIILQAEATERAVAAQGTMSAIMAAQTAQVVELTRQAASATDAARQATQAELDRRTLAASQTTATAAALTSTADAMLLSLSLASTRQAASATQAESAAQATQAEAIRAGEREQFRMELDRQASVNQVMAWTPYLAGSLLFAALLLVLVKFLPVEVNRRKVIGDVIIDERSGRLNALIPAASLHAGLSSTTSGPQLLPGSEASQVALQRMVLAARVLEKMAAAGATVNSAQMMRMLDEPASLPAVSAAPLSEPASPELPASADWSLFTTYDGPAMPIGLDQAGVLMLQDLERMPHRLIAGRSGGGKSRYGMRPAIAAALARGMVVTVIGEVAPVDFKVFDGHPNYYAQQVDDPALVLGYLSALLVEVRRRMDVLYKEGASTWGRLNAGPRVVVVMDEYAAFVDSLDGAQRSHLFALTANLSRLARKAGVHLLCGVQNPTRDNVRPSIRRNMLTQAFSMVDAQASRAILEADGAERLSGAQYLVMMDQLVRGAAWAPSDEQISAYLASHRTNQEPAPECLVRPVAEIAPAAPLNDAYQRQAAQVRQRWQAGEIKSKSDLARALGLRTAGADWSTVVQVWNVLSSSSPLDGGAGEEIEEVEEL